MSDFAEYLLGSMEEEEVFDQPCHHGHRVGGHAVYCHNMTWEDAPRKCRNTWYNGGPSAAREGERDEDCPGYKPNEDKSRRFFANE